MVSGDSADHDPVRPVRVFLLFAPEDETDICTLRKHLKPLVSEKFIQLDEPDPGDSPSVIYERCLESDVLLVVHSPDYQSNDSYQELLKSAVQRLTLRIVPVLLRPAVLDGTAMAGLNALPKNQQPVIVSSILKSGVWDEGLPAS